MIKSDCEWLESLRAPMLKLPPLRLYTSSFAIFIHSKKMAAAEIKLWGKVGNWNWSRSVSLSCFPQCVLFILCLCVF